MNRPSRIWSVLLLGTFVLAACGGGGGSTPAPTPTPTPTLPPGQAAEDCPTSGSLPSSTVRGTPAQVRHAAPSSTGAARYVPGTIVVTYAASAPSSEIERVGAAFSVHMGPEVAFTATGLRSRTFAVDPLRVDEAMSSLRKTAGVKTVERAQYRHRLSVSAPNDPYYLGFGVGAPYYESATVPGQWDMHVMNTAGAWGNFSTAPTGGAIAIIDTGVDVTHPELTGGKIVRTECFVTYPSGTAQSTGVYVTDTDGHGTNVAGIADADTNNSFGFAGVGYNAPMLAYRIFPTAPQTSTGCEGSGASDPRCQSTDVDEVSAINDAVANGAKVINLSLGATGPLANCQDTIEENAVENAIKSDVVVVAAAGNDGTSYLGCPAAYPGVIAVGASGLTDSGSPPELVASYSDYTSTQPSGGGAYLVAPGGTATSGNDSNNLHWIANITSSQQFDPSQFCGIDYNGQSGDCQALYTGTSQATPHVAGVASLILGVRPQYTPAQVATALCATAANISDPKQGCGRVDAGAAVSYAATH